MHVREARTNGELEPSLWLYMCCTSNVALVLYFFFIVAVCASALAYGGFYVYDTHWTSLAKELRFDAFFLSGGALLGVVLALVTAGAIAVQLPIYVGIACIYPLETYRALRDGTPLPIARLLPHT